MTNFVHVHSNFLAERFIMETTRTRMGVQRSAVAFHSEVCRPSHALLVSVSVTHVSRNPSKCTAVCPANLTETVQMNIQRASLRCNSEVCHPLCPKLSPEPARTDGLSPLAFRNPATLHLGIRPHTHPPHITPFTHTIAPGCVFNQPANHKSIFRSRPPCAYRFMRVSLRCALRPAVHFASQLSPLTTPAIVRCDCYSLRNTRSTRASCPLHTS